MSNKKSHRIRIILMGYPDNPIGGVFLSTFFKKNLLVSAVVVEKKPLKANWTRWIKKIKKDGIVTGLNRIRQVVWLRIRKQNLVDLSKTLHIPIFWVNKFNSIDCSELLKSLNPDILAIASAPILKENIFSQARMGCLNAHPGWLPKYRGIGANSYALKNGDTPGISIHYINAGIDTGKIIIREKIKIQPGDTVTKINDRAVARGAELMSVVIHHIQEGILVIQPIDEPIGELYRAMNYREVRKINKKLKTKVKK